MKKRITVLLLSLTMIWSFCLIGVFSLPVAAANNGVQEKLDKLRAVYYTGTYFTASGNAAHYTNTAESHINNIPSRSGLPAGNTMGLDGTSCWAFAQYCFVYIYGSNFYTASQVSSPSLGDAISLNNGAHYAIYLGEDSSNYYVYDGNYDYYCGVRYNGTLSKSNWSISAIYHAKNYNQVYGSSTITYTNITAGNYFIKNKGDGNYLNISYGEDKDGTLIHTYPFGNYDSQVFNIYKSSDGYEMMPLCSSTRVVNPYCWEVVSGKTVNLYTKSNDSTQWWKFQASGDGYVIRNVQNPSVCLTSIADGLLVSTYTGASSQIWYLEKACTIKYNANGGSGAPSSQRVRAGYSTTVSTSTPTKKCNTFLGWSSSSSASTASVKKGGSITVQSDTTLYSVWTTSHSYGSWSQTTAPTCTGTGVEVRTCSSCGAKQTRSVAAKGHSYSQTFTQDKAPTCAKPGSKSYHCTKCSAKTNVTVITATGDHKYNNSFDTTCNLCGGVREIKVVGWRLEGGTWYYFNEGGTKATGWQSIGGTWYYFNAGGAMQTGWQNIGGTWYYFNGGGAMATGWQLLGGTWYYFNASGAMVTGWQNLGGTWYYFASGGAMQTGWVFDGVWYYMTSGGSMATGWQFIGGTWYYFNVGGAMQIGWVYDGAWYYLYGSGAMATNIYISGGWIDASGVWHG